MKRTFSVVYTVIVIVALVAVVAVFGWKGYQARLDRIAALESSSGEYARRFADVITDRRDVSAEVALAESLMAADPSLELVQIYSHDDGLRISVVSPLMEDFSRTPLMESDANRGFLGGIRFHSVSRPLRIDDMPGLEAVFLVSTLSGSQIRSSLMIILVTVAGLFALTILLILVGPRSGGKADEAPYEPQGTVAADETDPFSLPSDDGLSDDDFSLPSDLDDDFELPDEGFDGDDRLGEEDLRALDHELHDGGTGMDDDFDLPDFGTDELTEALPDVAEGSAGHADDLADRLELELERAASFNQDLSLILFAVDGDPGETLGALEDRIRRAYPYKDLVFAQTDGNYAVIDLNKDLDKALADAEEFVLERIDELGNRGLRVGISSRNGRLINRDRLRKEALGALAKTSGDKNIVAFRSDPEKYREFLKEQES